MAKLIDLKGKFFGYWFVLGKSNEPSNYSCATWECICTKCNITRKNIPSSSLTTGKTKQCRTCYKPTVEMVGRRFGEWLVLEEYKTKDTKLKHWRCKCLGCHNIYVVSGNALRRGKNKQCRACWRKSLIGKKRKKNV